MKTILFVCIGNACRSQMAEGFMRDLLQKEGRDDIEVFSAGSSPMGQIPEITVSMMKEAGIDITSQWSKGIDELPRRDFDYVISLCGDRCPFVPADHHIDWPIPDPLGGPPDHFRQIRDQLKDLVSKFYASI